MEAKKTLEKISSDWILWKRELDREVVERDHNSELVKIMMNHDMEYMENKRFLHQRWKLFDVTTV